MRSFLQMYFQDCPLCHLHSIIQFPSEFSVLVIVYFDYETSICFSLCHLLLRWKFNFFLYSWSIPDNWSISLITTLESFQIFSTSVLFCCWNQLIVFFSWGWNFSSFPSGKEFWLVSCKFWMLCYNLPGSL